MPGSRLKRHMVLGRTVVYHALQMHIGGYEGWSSSKEIELCMPPFTLFLLCQLSCFCSWINYLLLASSRFDSRRPRSARGNMTYRVLILCPPRQFLLIHIKFQSMFHPINIIIHLQSSFHSLIILTHTPESLTTVIGRYPLTEPS